MVRSTGSSMREGEFVGKKTSSPIRRRRRVGIPPSTGLLIVLALFRRLRTVTRCTGHLLSGNAAHAHPPDTHSIPGTTDVLTDTESHASRYYKTSTQTPPRNDTSTHRPPPTVHRRTSTHPPRRLPPRPVPPPPPPRRRPVPLRLLASDDDGRIRTMVYAFGGCSSPPRRPVHPALPPLLRRLLLRTRLRPARPGLSISEAIHLLNFK